MAKMQSFQLQAIPGTLVPNAIYYIEDANGNDAQMYITDAASALHNVGNTGMITTIANALIASAFSAQNSVVVYADIAARDADTLTKNTLAVVKDASADPTVDAGAALYIYELTPVTFSKLSEFESLDVTLDWSSIQNGPASSPAQIDDAVTKRHTHANQASLDRITVNVDDCLDVDGVDLKVAWSGVDW
jgi:hypothetical protein